MVRLGAPLEGSHPAIEALGLDYQTNIRLMRERGYIQLEGINSMINDIQNQIPYGENSNNNNNNNNNNSKNNIPGLPPKPLTEAKKKDLKKELSNLKRQRLWAEVGVEKLRMNIRGTILNEGTYVPTCVEILDLDSRIFVLSGLHAIFILPVDVVTDLLSLIHIYSVTAIIIVIVPTLLLPHPPSPFLITNTSNSAYSSNNLKSQLI